MEEKYLINARIIDPKNDMDEIGGLIVDSKGLVKAVGKKVTKANIPAKAEKIDLCIERRLVHPLELVDLVFNKWGNYTQKIFTK